MVTVIDNIFAQDLRYQCKRLIKSHAYADYKQLEETIRGKGQPCGTTRNLQLREPKQSMITGCSYGSIIPG